MGNEKPRTGPKAILFGQGKSLLLMLLSWVCFIVYIRFPRGEGKAELGNSSSSDTVLPPANLHVLVPASKADPNLCKVILSGGITGFPAPVLINWGQDFTDAKYVEGGSHLAKITGIHDYLSRLSDSEDESLVFMVDGFDVWMQLRPQTLLDRYFDINRRAQKRIVGELGRTAEKHNIRQEIIFGCQKRCWPWTENDPPCYAVPKSTLPTNIYGPQTDTDIGDKDNPFIKYRPRYLNSGVAIGTVRAMRKLLKRALVLLEKEKNIGSDQWIFSHIFGDQEVWREVVRRDDLSGPMRLLDETIGRHSRIPFNAKHIEEVRAKAAEQDDQNLEFGIGLDYGSEIGLNTVFAEDDTEWLTWSDKQQLRMSEEKLGIPLTQSRMHDLAQDVSQTVPPFWTFSSEGLPRWTAWRDIPLFTNVWTGTVPVAIHHNAHRDGRKALRKTWWDRIWFQKHARLLYDTHIYEPTLPVAHSGYDETMQRDWWPAERWKGGGRNGSSPWRPEQPSEYSGQRWVRFDDICRDYHEEIFRDGKGPWKLPVVH